MTEGMPLEATIKFCDPIRVPVNDPLFRERHPAVRAKLTPAVSFPSQPVALAPERADASPSAELFEARRQVAFYKSMHSRSADHVKALQRQLAQAETRCRAKAAAR